MASLFPIFLDLRSRPVLVVGGGPVARQKLEALSSSGARITVVAMRFSAECREAAARIGAEPIERAYRPADLDGVALAFAATGIGDVNRTVVRDARARGIPVNAVDDPEHCDFHTPAMLHRGPVSIALSTEGRFPGLAKALRKCLEAWLPIGDAEPIERLYRLRAALRKNQAGRGRALRELIQAVEKTYLDPWAAGSAASGQPPDGSAASMQPEDGRPWPNS
ncbi:MAG: bifunctional precorrin-2 dehydrogenase/sirohydrochlorin ferrochelatase [SAR324 cluster bacterium]|nr:bifunctional precorrin-2 dehydrogenase/sirohydrochlorin ferrochelatase [SAR324 cluster bacterium]